MSTHSHREQTWIVVYGREAVERRRATFLDSYETCADLGAADANFSHTRPVSLHVQHVSPLTRCATHARRAAVSSRDIPRVVEGGGLEPRRRLVVGLAGLVPRAQILLQKDRKEGGLAEGAADRIVLV